MKKEDFPDTFEELTKFIREKFKIDLSKDIQLEYTDEENETKLISNADDYSKKLMIQIMNSENAEITINAIKKKVENIKENEKKISGNELENKEFKLKIEKLNKIIMEKDNKIKILENKNRQLLEENANNIKTMKKFVDELEKIQKKENELIEKENNEYIKKIKSLEKENKELKNKLNDNNNKKIENKENNKLELKEDDFEEKRREDSDEDDN